MNKESKIIKEIHKIREDFYRETRGKDHGHVLKLIKEGSNRAKQKLETIESDLRLAEGRRYRLSPSSSLKETHHIRERKRKYEK